MSKPSPFQNLTMFQYIGVCLLVLATLLILSFMTALSWGVALWAALGFSAVLWVGLLGQAVWHNRWGGVSVVKGQLDLPPQEKAPIADNIGEAVVIINRHLWIIYANPAAQRLLGLKDFGVSIASVMTDPAVLAHIKDTFSGKKPDPVIHHITTPVERYIRVVGSGIRNEPSSQRIERSVIAFYDVTEMVRVNSLRADFLANASHELKTPVASLLGYIETLRGHAKDDPEAQETFLGIMQQQAERMQRLIDDLLSLRRIEIAEHIEPTETADLFLATRAAMEVVKPLAKKEDVSIKYNGPKEVLVIGVQDELVQLVLNLLDNAVAVSKKKQRVRLNIFAISGWTEEYARFEGAEAAQSLRREIVPVDEVDSDYAVLQIIDGGPGFPKEHISRIAERFYKVSGAHRPRGTGLGLAIVKHIMRRHRGGLYIDTQPNIGTQFTIVVPLSPQHMLDEAKDINSVT